jgi:phage gp36-like protein
MSSYATGTDFLKRFDARTTGDLCSDDGNRVPPALLLTDPNLLAALSDASGVINSAIFQGNRYQASDIAQLTDVDLSLLIRLCCNLAFGLLMMRRGNDVTGVPQYQEALRVLEQLKKGERIFNIQSAKDAGTGQAEFLSPIAKQNTNLIVNAAAPFFATDRFQQITG